MRDKIYELKRNRVMKHITRNLGKVVEEDDRLVCYVDKRRIKKEQRGYIIPCCGIYPKDRELSKKYGLEKSILYVIDGIDFEKNRTYIFGYENSEVLIKNCKLGLDTYISVVGKCTLDNVWSRNPLILETITIHAKELIIKDVNMLNDKVNIKNGYSISINASEKLEINNSIIGDVTSNVHINSNNKLNISSSKIKGSKLRIKAKRMVSSKNNWIAAVKKIDLEVSDFDEISVLSPLINCNGTIYSSSTKPMILNKTIDELKTSRLELIQLLKEMKSKIDTKNAATLEKCQASLNSKPIIKTLSKQ